MVFVDDLRGAAVQTVVGSTHVPLDETTGKRTAGGARALACELLRRRLLILCTLGIMELGASDHVVAADGLVPVALSHAGGRLRSQSRVLAGGLVQRRLELQPVLRSHAGRRAPSLLLCMI